MAKYNQTQIDSKKRAFLNDLEEILKKHDVQIAGYGSGYEAGEGCVEITFNDGTFLTYSPEKRDDAECVVDASRVFDFD